MFSRVFSRAAVLVYFLAFSLACSVDFVIMKPQLDAKMDEMRDFLIEHQAEMEELVSLMMDCSPRSSGEEFTECEYNVRQRKLIQTHYAMKNGICTSQKQLGSFTEHPVITKAGFLEEELFWFVFTDFDHRIVDNDICCFSRSMSSLDGRMVWNIYLFCCEEEPVEREYFPISPVIPHWYLYLEQYG